VSSSSPPYVRALDALLEGTVVLSFSRVGYEVRSRLADWSTAPSLPGTGRRVLVTGANSGLGYATVRALLAAGADVRMLVRSEDKGDDTLARLTADLGHDLGDRAGYDVADLADLGTVRAFAARQLARDEHLDAIVHNAGAMFDERSETVDGLEMTYQVHVVAPFLLTSLLLPGLAGASPSRVVTVTSGGMYTQKLDVAALESPTDYRPSIAYARAKRAQVTLTREWARRFGDHGIDFHVMHPGWVLTPGVESSLPRFRRILGPILRDPDQGADTSVWLALADDLPRDGRLWLDRHPRLAHKVPWTRPESGENARLWDRVCRDAGVTPVL
jgi:dehydrogenase/reductase SDR family member 12